MYISNNFIELNNNIIYIFLDNINNINTVNDIYICIEHMLTEWKREEYNMVINNKAIHRSTIFNFFNAILVGIDNIFIVDNNRNPLYYMDCDRQLINELVDTVMV